MHTKIDHTQRIFFFFFKNSKAISPKSLQPFTLIYMYCLHWPSQHVSNRPVDTTASMVCIVIVLRVCMCEVVWSTMDGMWASMFTYLTYRDTIGLLTIVNWYRYFMIGIWHWLWLVAIKDVQPQFQWSWDAVQIITLCFIQVSQSMWTWTMQV